MTAMAGSYSKSYRHGSFHRDRFHVVTMVSNPSLYGSRMDLYWKFKSHMEYWDVQLHTVEVQLGDRPFMVTEANNPNHTQLRGWDCMWIKERALNVGITNVLKKHPDAEYICWSDADITFLDPSVDWVQSAIHQLQHYKYIQMWENAVNFGPSGECLNIQKSFMSEYVKNGCYLPESGYTEKHPGFCHAARREFFEEQGPGELYDRSILGAGDRVMCLALINKAQHSFHPKVHSAYKNDVMRYQSKCHHTIRRDVGYLPVSIGHYFHGSFKNRRYYDRWQILVKNKFRPHHDIKIMSNGLFAFHDDHSERYIRLRDEIRTYFSQRNEDGLAV